MPDDQPSSDLIHTDYVTCADWLSPAGRADHVDEIADQFERRPATAARANVTHWPAHSRGWRLGPGLRSAAEDRLAG